MSRSNYIYLIEIKGKIYSAFTVKRELRTSLSNMSKDEKDGFKVYRFRDGKPRLGIEDITDVIDFEINEP